MQTSDPTRRPRADAVALLVAGAFFMENLDGTVIATALPDMARSFQSTPGALAIGMTAYLLTLAVFIPASGWAADRYGPRTVFSCAIALFTLASILCGLSTGAVGFTLARILQGGAGALMVPVGRLVVLRGTAKADLIRAVATLTWPGLVAPVIGPPVGGLITTVLSWRWIFFINVPLGVVGLCLALRLIGRAGEGERRPFDTRGFLLNGASLSALLYALDRFGDPTADPRAAGLVLAASAMLGALAVRHARRHAHPLVPLDAFGVATFRTTMAGGSVSRIAISTMPFLLPLLFQVGLGLDPFRAGLLVLWYGLANIGIKPATTPILRRFGFRPVLLVNTVLTALSIGLCATIGPGTPVAVTGVLLMLAGASRSMQFTCLNTLAFADMPPAMTSAANTLFNVGFQLCIGLGIAGGAILLRVMQALAGTGAGATQPFHLVFLVAAALAVLPVVAYLRLPADAGAEVSGRAARA